WVARVEYVISIELVTAAVEPVRARFKEQVYHAARSLAVLGTLVGSKNLELLHRFDAEHDAAGQVERRNSVTETQIHAFLQITIIDRTRTSNSQRLAAITTRGQVLNAGLNYGELLHVARIQGNAFNRGLVQDLRDIG